MKGKTKNVLIMFSFLIIVLGVALFINHGDPYVLASTGMCSVYEIESGDQVFVAEPHFGEIRCQSISSQMKYTTPLSVPGDSKIIGAPWIGSKYSDGTKLTCGFNERGDSSHCDALLVESISPSNVMVQFYLNDKWENKFTPVHSVSYTIVAEEIPTGVTLTIRCVQPQGAGVYLSTPCNAKFGYTPYGLVVNDGFSAQPIQTDSCYYSSLATKDYVDLYKTGSAHLNYDTSTKYISRWVPTYMEFMPNYNGQRVFCDMGTIREAVPLQLERAGCTYIPGDIVDKKECCPGSYFGSTLKCNDNFELEPITEDTVTGCSSTMQCRGSGHKTFYTDKTGAWFVEQCIEGNCVVTMEGVEQCAPPDLGCDPGYLCDLSTYTCVLAETMVPIETKPGSGAGALGMASGPWNVILVLLAFMIVAGITFSMTAGTDPYLRIGLSIAAGVIAAVIAFLLFTQILSLFSYLISALKPSVNVNLIGGPK